MKRYLLSLALVGLLAGCASDDTRYESSGGTGGTSTTQPAEIGTGSSTADDPVSRPGSIEPDLNQTPNSEITDERIMNEPLNGEPENDAPIVDEPMIDSEDE